jgi:hypothetical protein
MKVEKPIHQRIDLGSKLVGVILVAVGIDHLRRAQINTGLLYIFGGGAISLIPMFIKVKK